jgi:hypothetical protein
MGAESIDVNADEGAFFHIDGQMTDPKEEGGHATRKWLMSGDEKGGRIGKDADFVPGFAGIGHGGEFLAEDGLCWEGENVDGDFGGFAGAAVGAGKDGGGTDAGAAGDLENLAKFLLSFACQFAIGVAHAGGGIRGDAVAHEIDFHIRLFILAY